MDERDVECTACHATWKEAPGAAAGPCPACGKSGTRLVKIVGGDAAVAVDAVVEIEATHRPVRIVAWRWMIPTISLTAVGPLLGFAAGLIQPIVGLVVSFVLGAIGLAVGLKAGGERIVIERYRKLR